MAYKRCLRCNMEFEGKFCPECGPENIINDSVNGIQKDSNDIDTTDLLKNPSKIFRVIFFLGFILCVTSVVAIGIVAFYRVTNWPLVVFIVIVCLFTWIFRKRLYRTSCSKCRHEYYYGISPAPDFVCPKCGSFITFGQFFDSEMRQELGPIIFPLAIIGIGFLFFYCVTLIFK